MERVVICKPPLRTETPEALLSTHRTFKLNLPRLQPVEDGPIPVARFELGACQAIDPGAVLLLMYATRCAWVANWTPLISSRRNPSAAFEAVKEHLDHLRALKSERPLPKHLGDYPLRGVVSETDLVSELEEWAECVGKVAEVTPEEMALWTTHISELATNSFQHGRTGLNRHLGAILIAGAAHKKDGIVQFAVLDTGSGIPAVLRPHVPHLHGRPDCRIIREACKRRITSHCDPANQGLGLPGLVDAVRKSRGTLQILSGNGLCHLSNGRLYTRDLTPHSAGEQILGGTLAVITLKGTKWKA
jgi:hypothetical protein